MLPYTTLLQIDKGSTQPVYRQIAGQIVQHIRTGVLKPGALLPGTRELASQLSLHRKTIVAAYNELLSQGWLEVTPKKGFNITRNLPELKARSLRLDQSAAYGNRMAIPFYGQKAAITIRAKEPPIRLVIDDGHPDPRLTPLPILMREYASRIKLAQRSTIIPGSLTAGTQRLRTTLAGYLQSSRGIQAGPEHLIVTHGAQMSIYLAAKILLRPGDNAIIGDPIYPVAAQLLENTGARIIRTPVDDQGMDIAAIEKACKRHPIKLLYLIPHHHHPTTVTLSPERRLRLLDLCTKYNFAILEDDYDYDYHYNILPHLPLASYRHQGRVIYIGSFSKSLASNVRLGFMVGSADFISQAAQYRRLIDLRNDNLLEDALATLIANGDIHRYLKKANKTYSERLDNLDHLLRTHLPDKIIYRRPTGGMAAWVRFRPGNDLPAIARRAAKKGLYISNGKDYNNAGISPNGLRIGFASLLPEEMNDAIGILSQCI
ncbi:MAG TPA: PLP-dependent aminotransferase family protein [Puia sp.]|nr:PLP-dependent aminotransferase family protein [Puia sp.]